MAGKEFTIVDGVVFNGARDTDGGIWIRINDDDDHRIMGAAISKQIKNTEAAKGTLSALDPNAPHGIDYIIEALNRVLASVNGARPASAQLKGTPIGSAIDEASGGGKKGKKKKGAAAQSGVVGSIGSGVGTEEIQWAENVPSPRPRVGSAFWPTLASTWPRHITAVIGYDDENSRFVVESADGRATIVFDANWQEWIDAENVPAGPSNTTPEVAAIAVKELLDALRAGPAHLEDEQFTSAANVARMLLLIVATPNNQSAEIRTVAEYIVEYRSLDANPVELAGGIEYDLSQAQIAGGSGGESAAIHHPDDELRADIRKGNASKRKAAKPAGKPKPGGGRAAGGGGGKKRKR